MWANLSLDATFLFCAYIPHKSGCKSLWCTAAIGFYARCFRAGQPHPAVGRTAGYCSDQPCEGLGVDRLLANWGATITIAYGIYDYQTRFRTIVTPCMAAKISRRPSIFLTLFRPNRYLEFTSPTSSRSILQSWTSPFLCSRSSARHRKYRTNVSFPALTM